MHPSEIVFIVLLAGGFLILPAIFKQWKLLCVFAAFFVCFGLIEWWSVATTGFSVSQWFWIMDTEAPWKGWVLVGGMQVAWLALLWHFKAHKPYKK